MQILWFFTPMTNGVPNEPPGATDFLLHNCNPELRFSSDVDAFTAAYTEGNELARRWQILMSKKGITGAIGVQMNKLPRPITDTMQIDKSSDAQPAEPTPIVPPAPGSIV